MTRTSFEDALKGTPEQFDFFEALRLIERAHKDRPRLGTARRSEDDPVRLGQRPFVHFPASSIQAFEPGDDDPARLWVYVFGLFGPNGPLPYHLTVQALERQEHDHDPSLVRFINLFQHRMTSFLYRAWAEAEPTVQHDRPLEDRFSLYVGALCGLGLASQRERDVVPDVFKFHHAGMFGLRTRPPAMIETVVGDFFEADVMIEEFVGGWLSIPEDRQCRLGRLDGSMRLGAGAVLGAWSYQRQHRFRIILGPLELETYQGFLPGRRGLAELSALVRLLIGDELEWDLQLLLAGEDVPAMQLPERGAAGAGAQLGWTSWLGGGDREDAADDLVLGGRTLERVAQGERLDT